jgi:hypothetical protein
MVKMKSLLRYGGQRNDIRGMSYDMTSTKKNRSVKRAVFYL